MTVMHRLRYEAQEKEKEAKRQQQLDRKLAYEAMLKELDVWEDNLFKEPYRQQMKAMWEVVNKDILYNHLLLLFCVCYRLFLFFIYYYYLLLYFYVVIVIYYCGQLIIMFYCVNKLKLCTIKDLPVANIL